MKEFMKFKENKKNENEEVKIEEGRKADWSVMKAKGRRMCLQRGKSYEEALNKIQAATEIFNIKELVQSFITGEKKFQSFQVREGN